MKEYYLIFFIIILFIWLLKNDNEQFVNNDDINETLENNWDGILKTTTPTIATLNTATTTKSIHIHK